MISGRLPIFLVILTGFLGAWLARMEGMNTMMKLKANLQQGLMPAEELIDAVIIFIAGVVLITPGLITDVFGLLLLWPVTRNKFKQLLRKKFDEIVDFAGIEQFLDTPVKRYSSGMYVRLAFAVAAHAGIRATVAKNSPTNAET